MMESSHNLVLNEDALKLLPKNKRPIYVFEWLRYLDKVLEAAHKCDIKESQNRLVEQLVGQMSESPGPPTRKLLSRCLATVFSVGDTFLLFETVNKCNDILKNKDDSPSYLPTRLSAVSSIGAMYEKLGRMMGRSYEETVQILVKAFKNSESQLRIEIMNTLKKIIAGMDSAASNVHKDIYKTAKLGLTDRVQTVRSASAMCLLELISCSHFLYTTELETLSQVCYKAFDGSSYNVRCSVAKLLGTLLATTQNPPKELTKGTSKGSPVKLPSLEEALNILLLGFMRGNNSSFLKGTGEMIKGSSVSREVKVGVTQCYVVFVQELGNVWLEKNMSALLKHMAELVGSPKASATHVEAVYSRKCVAFVLRMTLCKMLGEKSQLAACKEITYLIVKQMNIDASVEGKEISEGGQHVLICLLEALGTLVLSLGTTSSNLVLDTHLNLLDAVVAVLLHPSTAARLTAAWCLRCISLALPSQIHPLLVRCQDRLDSLKTSPQAISGYSCLISALVGSVRYTSLGIPHKTGKVLFNVAEDLLRTASQSSRLSLQRTSAGWLIIGSLMTLGVGVVRGLLPRMFLLWKNSFPRSSKEIDSEKSRGDAFTWQVTLEGRAGALASMHSFLLCCPELSGEDTVRRLLLPIEAAVLMLSSISGIVKQYGQQLKAATAMVRLRLYEVLALLPQQSFESQYTSILKLLVSEFTLSNSPSNTTTSLLRAACHSDDSVILESWLLETDHKVIEEQLQPNSASGSGALEHDPCSLYRLNESTNEWPGPLPLGVAVIDASVSLFGKMFPLVANKHRLKMLNLFGELLRAGKNQRQESIQMNVFTAVLIALKRLSEMKTPLGQDDVKKAAIDLVLGGLTHPNAMLRCAAGEGIGRMAQVVGDPRFVAEMAQNSFDKLKSERDAISRTGHSLALGCLHRYVGGMGSGQHLSTSISILLALAKDATSPIVQVWSLHALSLIADSGGPMFRTYLEPSLSLMLELLLSVPPHAFEVHHCIGKGLQALITTVGPELQGNESSMASARWSLLGGCGIIQEHHEPTVQAEAITCLQQMHMFAPRHVNLSSLVPVLVIKLSSSHLLLRRAAMSCLRQLVQREAQEVCDHAYSFAQNAENLPVGFVRTELGLPGLLFNLLDSETDSVLVQNIHHTLTSILLALATSQLSLWLTLCREVLTSATDSGNEESEVGIEGENDDDMAEFHAGGEPDPHPAIPPRWRTRVFAAHCVSKIILECGTNRAHFDLALAREMQTTKMKGWLRSGGPGNILGCHRCLGFNRVLATSWDLSVLPTSNRLLEKKKRGFIRALEVVLLCCSGDFLVLHLSELVRVGFMAATSESDELRLNGLHILLLVIEKFAKSSDPEFPGHVILEQYQAQVGAALRPAFSPDTASNVTAKACEVCSAWIGSGVARDLSDLRRVHQLLVSSLDKLSKGGSNTIYNESASTLEKLAILKAWAEVYIVSISQESSQESVSGSNTAKKNLCDEPESDSLLVLVMPELVSLSRYWIAALKDFALLSLPPEFSSQLPHGGGAFYTNETADSSRGYYGNAWPPILLAVALWLSREGFEIAKEELAFARDQSETPEGILASIAIGGRTFNSTDNKISKTPQQLNADRIFLLLGICLERLCSPNRSDCRNKDLQCLRSLESLLASSVPAKIIAENQTLAHEIITIMHRQILSSDSIEVHIYSARIVALIVDCSRRSLQDLKSMQHKEMSVLDEECDGCEVEMMGEGGEDGSINLTESVVFAVLQVALCSLIRRMPEIAPQIVASAPSLLSRPRLYQKPVLVEKLLVSVVGLLKDIPDLCSPPGGVVILPSILHLLTGVLKECSKREGFEVGGALKQAVLNCFGHLAGHRFSRFKESEEQWCSMLQSALATIVDYSKTADKDHETDEILILEAVAELIFRGPEVIVRPHGLQYPTINMFKLAFQSPRSEVQVACVKAMQKIFTHPSTFVSSCFMHNLAPRVLEFLSSSSTSSGEEFNGRLFACCVDVLQSLIPKALTQYKSEIVGFLVNVLVTALGKASSKGSESDFDVHEFALERLQKIGPAFPQEFRHLLTHKPELRVQLEASLKQKQKSELGSTSCPAPLSTGAQHNPTIKLKTDFSNFAKM